jgi:ABC-2 type transport system permease protein
VSFLRDLYGTFTRVAIAVELQYRASSVIWLLGIVVEPVIYLAVWSAAAEAQGGSIGGYTPADFAAYYLVLTLVNQLTADWHMWEFQYRVQQGQFAFLLLRPVHPIHGDLAENFAHKLVMQAVLLPALLGLALVFRPHAQLEFWSLLAFVPALALAFALRFVLEWAIALACFWTTRINAVNQTYFIVLFFLSGRVAPLAILPMAFQNVAAALPFRWMVAFPVETALGRLTPDEVAVGLTMQLGWIVLAWLVLEELWPRALQRFSAVGN